MMCRLLMVILITFPTAALAADWSERTFELPGPNDSLVVVRPDQSDFTVVGFLGAECPVARLYGPRLQQLADSFDDRVRFVGVNSNQQDSLEDVTQFVSSLKLKFPVAKDFQNVVADRYDAKRTPEVFLLDRDLQVIYRGLIDDQYQPGTARAESSQQYLRNAIEDALAGRPVAQPSTDAVGCLIGRTRTPVQNSRVAWTRQVSGVLETHCNECHRAGEIGPFALTDYEEAIGWGEMIVEVIDNDRMPPWHANPKHGSFANARFMPESDKQVLRDWVEAGMPYGEAAVATNTNDEPKTAATIEHDVVLPMRDRPFEVPAEGTVEYRYFVVDPQFEEDHWVTRADIIPGNRSVVHHVIVFIRPPDGTRLDGVGWLTAYVPGQRPVTTLDGHARRIPAGARLVFQMHYTPNGHTESDQTQVGLTFTEPDSVTHEMVTLIAINQDFEIPPGAADHEVSAHVRTMPKKGSLLAIAPHMHVRGKSIRVAATRDGQHGPEREILLDVPRYDFNWQHFYILDEPMPLDDVNRIDVMARFDNSSANPVNPDPEQYVTWGDQTWEEMAIGFFEVAIPRELGFQYRPRGGSREARNKEANRKADLFVADFLKRYDSNGDGTVRKSEVPLALRQIGWGRSNADKNNDEVLTREELREAARRRYRQK